MPIFTVTNESITVVLDGKATTVQKGAVNFNVLKEAIFAEDWDSLPEILTPKDALSKYLPAGFTLGTDGSILFYDRKVEPGMTRRIHEMAAKGEDPAGLLHFFARLSKNPSKRSVDNLWAFLDHEGIPIESSGHFLAYKGVNADLTDHHTGTIDNSPGQVHKMDRNLVSDDPRTPCHFGFHVGALGYANDFGGEENEVMICRVDPEKVVCIPYDCSSQKMRVCEYEVVGYHVNTNSEANPLPNTTFEDDTVDYSADNEEDDLSDTDREVAEAEENMYSTLADVDRSSDGKGYTISEPEPEPKKTPALGRLDAKGLLKANLADLRTYASKTLKIVGASKLAGGKTALVKRILKVRKTRK